jgi:ribonuclease P protein component
MFFYQSKDRLSFEEINTKTIQLIEKFLAQINAVSKEEQK